jgi:hypothetical protein
MTERPGFPKFKGSFKSFSVSSHTNREKGIDVRLFVYSQGSRTAVVKYLWLKYLWDELSKEEMRLFLTLPETLNSEIKVNALRAVLILGKKRTRNRLNEILTFLQRETYTRESYQGIKNLSVEIYEEQRSLARVPKFSGWIKSSSAKGSKRSSGPSYLEPLAINENDFKEIEIDWYQLITVGDSILLSQWNKKIILKRPDRSKRSKNSSGDGLKPFL